MGIEQDIQQTKAFTNAYQKASVNILFTHGWIQDKMKAWLSPHGITMKQYNVLRILKGANAEISTCVLRERMIDRMSDVSRLVDRMVLKGWISKTVSPHDKRLIDIKIEGPGLQLLYDAEERADKMDQALRNLTEKEASQLSDLLEKLRGS